MQISVMKPFHLTTGIKVNFEQRPKNTLILATHPFLASILKKIGLIPLKEVKETRIHTGMSNTQSKVINGSSG